MTVVREPAQGLVGRELIRHDAVEKVAGRTRYAADFALPGMLHAVLKRADVAHARLLGVDVSAAEAVPGVAAVLTLDEAGRIKNARIGITGVAPKAYRADLLVASV